MPVAATGTGGGGAAACCSSAYLFACRLATRPETAVAVPATTAVRATARTSPGPRRIRIIVVPPSLSSLRAGEVECCLDHLVWDPIVVQEDPVRVPDRLRELRRPGVLPHEEGGRRVRLQFLA